MTLDEAFADAQTRSRTLPAQSPQALLELYGWFKQATAGDAVGKRPGPFDVRARAKFDAWASHAGVGADEAKKAYIAVVDRLQGRT